WGAGAAAAADPGRWADQRGHTAVVGLGIRRAGRDGRGRPDRSALGVGRHAARTAAPPARRAPLARAGATTHHRTGGPGPLPGTPSPADRRARRPVGLLRRLGPGRRPGAAPAARPGRGPARRAAAADRTGGPRGPGRAESAAAR